MTRRREFIGKIGIAAAAMTFDTAELRAATLRASPKGTGPWDTSWLDRLTKAQYRVVFNASEINDGAVLDYAATFLDHFHEAHDTTDAQTRPVIVFRRLGTSMALNDTIWERYAIGDDKKINDPATHAPARRNVFWKGVGGSENSSNKIKTLHARGMISLVCNIALNNVGSRLATQSNRAENEVQKELRANLVPGAILVPSGIYALIRSQNAGCAYMPGT